MLEKPFVLASKLSKRFDMYSDPVHRLWDLIAAKQKSKRTEFWALKDINFSIRRGESVAIIGRNGSGKSTLLQLVCSILRPTEGIVSVKGRIAALLELGSGFNAQFTGRENIFLYAAILGMSRAEIHSRYDDIVKFADLGRFIDFPLSTYSSGMVVRLAFATAIHVSPDLLVVDEALAVGDTAFQQKCLMRIRKMQEQGVSILLVTHSSNAAIEFCDRAIYLRQGRLVNDGTVTEIVKQYAADLVVEELRDIDPISRMTRSGDAAPNSLVESHADTARQVLISSVELYNSNNQIAKVFTYGEKISILIKLEVRNLLELPCCGIQLTSADGIVLWSCTTQSADFKFSSIQPGITELKWGITANFSGNRYILSVGMGSIINGEYKRHHRLEYAAHFDVMPKPKSGAGWLCPLPTFSVSHE